MAAEKTPLAWQQKTPLAWQQKNPFEILPTSVINEHRQCSATLSQPVFPKKTDPDFPWENSKSDTVKFSKYETRKRYYVIMKNFNRRNSYGHHGSKRRENTLWAYVEPACDFLVRIGPFYLYSDGFNYGRSFSRGKSVVTESLHLADTQSNAPSHDHLSNFGRAE